MKRTILKILSLSGAAAFAVPAAAALNVFACEPEWAALAQELGGDKVSVFSATTARQDPHRLEARPSLIARIRGADLVICSGSELEIGWLPLLLTQSGNDRIQPGSPGFIEASQFVIRLEVPKVIDRALGDIHPSGNPHIHLDPRNIAKVGEGISTRLAEIDPANAGAYRGRADDFSKRWQQAMENWRKQAQPLKGVPLVVYHKDFSYFINWSGMREAGSLEPKPGIPPTPTHLAELVERMKRNPAKVVIYSAYNNPAAANFLAERANIPAVLMPYTVGGTPKAKDLFGLFDDTIERLLASVK
ncbi:MAG: zinc/manganese transport system substrate-binding protein [Betaproteobacteria bacterium]|jgi:zinc/manganese transport system substrate-binding protein|nr:zinc/manganese transport system substrate-binding protein [Betaproteobacteria bacterium]